jgi:ribosome-associated protein
LTPEDAPRGSSAPTFNSGKLPVTKRTTKPMPARAVRQKKTLPAREVLDLAVAASVRTKGEEIVALDLREHSSVCDYFLIVSGSSEQHLRALAKAIVTELAHAGTRPFQREGEVARRWILLDYVDVVVHIFHKDARDYYRLESLWGDADRVPVDTGPSGDDVS